MRPDARPQAARGWPSFLVSRITFHDSSKRAENAADACGSFAAVERSMSGRLLAFNQWRISRMPLKKPEYRRTLIVGTAILLVCATWPAPLLAEDAGIIAQSDDYFPDQIGNEWHYRGQITEGPLQTIEHKFSPMCLRSPARKPSRA